MNFLFDEEPQALADSLGKLVDRDYAFEARKAIIGSAAGRSPSTWQAMSELGVMLLGLSERAGGFGMGVLDTVPVMEKLGRALVTEPVVDNLLCARLLDRFGGQAQLDLLGRVAAGASVLALAHAETGADDDVARIGLAASQSGQHWTLTGDKIMVVHAASADALLVSARTAGSPGDSQGLSLFLVDPRNKGLTMRTMRTVDNFRAADIRFSACPAALVGTAGDAFAALDEAVDYATLLLCAEAVGIMEFANETTLEYLKTRKQFGVTIGTFQALQHRMVDLVISAQQARSIVYLAGDALDKAAALPDDASARSQRRQQISAAKIKVGDAARHIGQESIQLHGGMGMTDEMKISHAFKRLTVISQLHGDVDHHLARFAASAA